MITEELPSRRRSGDGRPPDRDAWEPFHKPADHLAREIQESLLEDGTYKDKDIRWIGRKGADYYSHDPRLYMHDCAVGVIAYFLSRKRGEIRSVQALAFAAGFTHDDGKVLVPTHVLYPDDPDAWEKNYSAYMQLVRQHSLNGYLSLREEVDTCRYAKRCALVALLHHRDQREPYPTDAELRELSVSEPKSGIMRRIVEYVIVGDNIEAKNRKDQQVTPSEQSSRVRLGEVDITHFVSVGARKVDLKTRMPHLATLIDAAFDGIVI